MVAAQGLRLWPVQAGGRRLVRLVRPVLGWQPPGDPAVHVVVQSERVQREPAQPVQRQMVVLVARLAGQREQGQVARLEGLVVVLSAPLAAQGEQDRVARLEQQVVVLSAQRVPVRVVRLESVLD